MTTIALLPDLLTLTAQAAPAAEAVCDIAKTKLRALVSDEGRVVNSLIEEHQTAAHGFAWVATYVAVSYTHSPSPRDRTRSRMPSSA